MVSGKPKQFVRPPPKKKPQKITSLETVDEFQDAAEFEEQAGGKHRGGDSVKSARAFLRALDVYDRGLQKHPKSFDLAYNKARLQLELSQQPNLVEHIGLLLPDWLRQTLESHRYALRLNEENPDVLFNTAQVLTSLAEQLSEEDLENDAVPLLHEAIELLSSCLSRQEMMFEQHRLDFPDTEDGGVALDPDEKPAASSSTSGDVEMTDEQSATVEVPVSANDLLDTVHASLSALTTLIPLSDQTALPNVGEMARSLTENKAPTYINMLPQEEHDRANFTVALDRAVFVAAFANRQYEFQLIELKTYLERLDMFEIPGKAEDLSALCSEAEARTELVLSALDRCGVTPDLPATLCWKQLSISQDLYAKATKLNSEDAKDRRAEIYKSKADLELLRHSIVNVPKADLSDGIRNSAKTLIQNAQTFYKGAVSHAKASGDDETEEEAQQRLNLAKVIAGLMYGGSEGAAATEPAMEALEECVDEGLVSEQLAQAIMEKAIGSRS